MRTDMVCKCHLSLPLAVLAPLCSEVEAAGGVWEVPPHTLSHPPPHPPPLTHTHTYTHFSPPLFPPLPLLQLMGEAERTTWGSRDPDQNHSLISPQVGINHTVASPSLSPTNGRGGVGHIFAPQTLANATYLCSAVPTRSSQALTASLDKTFLSRGAGYNSRSKLDNDIVYYISNKHRLLVKTHHFQFCLLSIFSRQCTGVYVFPVWACKRQEMDQFGCFFVFFSQPWLWFSASNIYAACPLGRHKIQPPYPTHTHTHTHSKSY